MVSIAKYHDRKTEKQLCIYVAYKITEHFHVCFSAKALDEQCVLFHDVLSVPFYVLARHFWGYECLTVRSRLIFKTVFAVAWLRFHGMILLLCSGMNPQLAPLGISSYSASTCS